VENKTFFHRNKNKDIRDLAIFCRSLFFHATLELSDTLKYQVILKMYPVERHLPSLKRLESEGGKQCDKLGEFSH
jgi:hypothetical protein